MHFKLLFFIMLQTAILLTGCSDSSSSSSNESSVTSNSCIEKTVLSNSVVVSWTANKEAAVNTTGGGYKVYYSSTADFSISGGGVTTVDVAYVSGLSSPTSKTLNLSNGTYYIKVQGYSALGGGTSGDVSCQMKVVVK